MKRYNGYTSEKEAEEFWINRSEENAFILVLSGTCFLYETVPLFKKPMIRPKFSGKQRWGLRIRALRKKKNFCHEKCSLV